jgi:hypothetical protein
MALVGKIETRPTSTTSNLSYRVMMTRCLLCGQKSEFAVPTMYKISGGDKIFPSCDCYVDSPESLQPVRIIPNDR